MIGRLVVRGRQSGQSGGIRVRTRVRTGKGQNQEGEKRELKQELRHKNAD